jgi:hypothetical protein
MDMKYDGLPLLIEDLPGWGMSTDFGLSGFLSGLQDGQK